MLQYCKYDIGNEKIPSEKTRAFVLCLRFLFLRCHLTEKKNFFSVKWQLWFFCFVLFSLQTSFLFFCFLLHLWREEGNSNLCNIVVSNRILVIGIGGLFVFSMCFINAHYVFRLHFYGIFTLYWFLSMLIMAQKCHNFAKSLTPLFFCFLDKDLQNNTVLK